MAKGPKDLDHDLVVRRLRTVAKKIALHDAANAWVASLASAPVRFRPVLAHLAYATNLPEHAFMPRGGAAYMCALCGAHAKITVDPTDVLEPIEKRGDAVVADLANALVDLESFAELAPIAPTEEDLACFNAMLDVIARLPATGRATDLVKAWGKVIARTNAYSRAALVETLGVCGLLETADHPGHLTRWVGFWEYQEMPQLGGDMRPPEAWWRGSDGVNRGALDLVFPHRGIDRRPFPKAKPRRRAIAKGATTVPKKGKNAALELRDGDLIAIEYENRWIAGVVLGLHRDGKKVIRPTGSGTVPKTVLPVIEMFAGSFPTRPLPSALAKVPARAVGPYLEAPHWRREPLAFEGLELFGPVMPVRLERLARDHAPPDDAGVPATHHRAIAPRNLLYLLSTLLASRAP